MQTLRYTSYQHLAHVQKRTQKCRAPCTAKLYTPCHQPPDGSMEVSTSPQEAPSCPPPAPRPNLLFPRGAHRVAAAVHRWNYTEWGWCLASLSIGSGKFIVLLWVVYV